MDYDLAIGETDWSSDFQPPKMPIGYERNFGKLRRDEGALQLMPVFDTSFPDNSVIVVRWGKRRYLLMEQEVSAFMEAVRTGEEPRSDMIGRFLLRHGDHVVPVSGQAQLGSLQNATSL